MDLSWNYAAESQAYDRVHRLGQEKEVFVKRLVVSNTIEERYVALALTHIQDKTNSIPLVYHRMLRLQDVKVGA